MEDYLIRVLAKESGIRGLACLTTGIANESIRRHKPSATAGAVLTRVMTGVSLLGALLKVQQRIAVKFEGTGPIGKVIAESDAYGKVRGYPGFKNADLPLKNGRFDLVGALGQAGLLTVVKDLQLKELVESVIPLETSDIAGDLTAFLNHSEQIPSQIEIGEVMTADGRVDAAGGLLIQAIPPTNEALLQQTFNQIQELPPIENLLKEGKTPEQILALLFAGIEYEILEKRPLQFKCTCSRERTEAALISLGREELEHILESEGKAEIECHFCHEEYLFDGEELALILEEIP